MVTNRFLGVVASRKDAVAIANRLAKENPKMTIAEYLDKYEKEVMILQ
jgi:hypothetical protein